MATETSNVHVDERLRRLIAGSVAEVDPRQIAIYRRLTPAQRVWQAARLSDWLRQANQRRLQRQAKQNSPMYASSSVSLIEFARLVIEALQASEVEYMLAGALAVAAWAEARSTQDVAMVVDVPVESMGRLSQELAKRAMLVPHAIILDVFLETRTDLPVNAIHLYAGYKAELFLLRPGDPYRETAFTRRRLVDMGPPLGEVYVHAPEDLILNKLRYFKISQQPKHTRDIASIMLALGDDLDSPYIEEWAERLELISLWHELKRLADERRP